MSLLILKMVEWEGLRDSICQTGVRDTIMANKRYYSWKDVQEQRSKTDSMVTYHRMVWSEDFCPTETHADEQLCRK